MLRAVVSVADYSLLSAREVVGRKAGGKQDDKRNGWCAMAAPVRKVDSERRIRRHVGRILLYVSIQT